MNPEQLAKMSALVTKQLLVADGKPLMSPREHFDWNCIRRTSHLIKSKVRSGSYTIDDEFNELQDNLKVMERDANSVIRYTKVFTLTTLKLLDSSLSIAETSKKLFDPYNEESVDKSNAFEKNYRIWENVNFYTQVISKIKPNIVSELALMNELTSTKLCTLLDNIKTIGKKIQLRSYALSDYDKSFNVHETLLIKQKSSELSVKESQQMFAIERKLTVQKEKYDMMNNTLKKELPYFFNLVKSILQMLLLIIFYIQLMVAYQIDQTLQSLNQVFDVTSVNVPNFSTKVMEEFVERNREAARLIDSLSIINFRENFLKSLTIVQTGSDSENTPEMALRGNSKASYVQANFTFAGEQPGDLSFTPGTIIKVLESEGSWWKGETNGRIGLFPSNYVELIKL